MSACSSRPPRRVASLYPAIVAASLLALAPPTALADTAPPFPALLERAQSASPQILQAQAAVSRARSLAAQAGYRPNPDAGLEVENFGGDGPNSGFDAAEITLEVGQTLELGGKRPARIDVGRASIAAAEAELVAARADLGLDLAIAYAEAEAAALRTGLARENLELAREDLRIVRARVNAGAESEIRALQTEGALGSAQTAWEAAEVEGRAALVRLAVLAGDDTAFSALSAPLLGATFAPVPGETANPGVLAAEARVRAAESSARLERAQAVPDISVGGGVRRSLGDDATTFLASVSTSLPLFDRNRGNIDAAAAEVTWARAELRAARLEANAGADLALAGLASAERRLAATREIERGLAETQRLTRVGYESGKLPLSEVVEARRALIDVRREIIDVELARLTARAALAHARGATLFGGQN